MSLAFDALAHDISHELARIGSEAELIAAECRRALRAAGLGPDAYREANDRINTRLEALGEARDRAASALRLAPLLDEPTSAPGLNLATIGVGDLLEGVLDLVNADTRHPPVVISKPPDFRRAAIVCDSRLATMAIVNMIQLTRENCRRGPSTLSWTRGDGSWVATTSVGPRAMLPDEIQSELGFKLASAVARGHGGTLEIIARTSLELRLPHDLQPGWKPGWRVPD